jgi:3-deoxy-7-phosphoheptulonate synthase
VSTYPLTDAAAATVVSGREQVEKVLAGEDDRLLVVVGPCSIHDLDGAREYASKLVTLSRELSDRLLVVMRVYFEKPRTTVGWKGLINDPHLDDSFDVGTGLRLARELLIEIADMGLSTATEFLEPITPQFIADTIVLGAIGARTTESPTHRQMASGLSYASWLQELNRTVRYKLRLMPCRQRRHRTHFWASTMAVASASCRQLEIRGVS